MVENNVTRRDFVRGGTVAAVGMALGLTPTYTVQAGNPAKADTGRSSTTIRRWNTAAAAGRG